MNLPKEFEEKMKTLLGSEYEEYTACYDEPRHYGLRVNTAKISVEDFLKIAPWPLEPVPWIENGFYYDGDHIQPSKHPYYFAGLYYLSRGTGYWMSVPHRVEKRRNWEQNYRGQVFLQPTT